MSHLILRASNFRALERLEWAPAGVCLLAGPNGAGKSTVLDALLFLRLLFRRGHESALTVVEGRNFKRIGMAEEEPVEFELEIEDLRWKLRFPMSPVGLKGVFGEELFRGGELILRAAMFDDGWYLGSVHQPLDSTRCCAKVLWDRGTADWMKPLVDALAGIRIHHAYELNQVKRPEPADRPDASLHARGQNLWSVLANWKAAPLRYQGQFEWVVSVARAAFPDLIGGIEFDRGLPWIYGPATTDPDAGLPPSRMADGLLTGLLHLTAVAGARTGGIVAFDEVENQLHPHAIRTLLSAMRERALTGDLTIVLTTHSPVVMNEFKHHEDQFFVIEPHKGGKVPVPLIEAYDPEWLAHFSLGDLYEREEFASPREAAASEPASSPADGSD